MLPVRVGDSRVFNIILDTGMHLGWLLLYNIEPEDSVSLENAIEVEVPGAGAGPPSAALMADSMSSLTTKEQRFTSNQTNTSANRPDLWARRLMVYAQC